MAEQAGSSSRLLRAATVSRPRAVGLALTLAVAAALVAPISSGSAEELGASHDFATPSSYPWGVAVGPEGDIWFTERIEDRIGVLDPRTDSTSDFPMPSPAVDPEQIAVGPEGNLWVTEEFGEGRIAEINPVTHAMSEFPASTAGDGPDGIVLGPEGNLWFAERFKSAIGEINPVTHATQEFPTPTRYTEQSGIPEGSEPALIVVGPEGNLWFTEARASKIGVLNPVTHASSDFSTPTPGSRPDGIAVGPEGDIWFTEEQAGKVGVINPVTHAISEFTPPGGGAGNAIRQIALGPEGNLWFTESTASRIGVIDPATHEITEFPTPTAAAGPLGIAPGPEGNVWFTEVAVGKIGYIGTIPPNSATGPTSTTKKAEMLICTRSRSDRHSVERCSSSFVALPDTFLTGAPLHAKLSRRRHVYAAGSLSTAGGQTLLRLRARHRPRHGRYTLTLTERLSGHASARYSAPVSL